MQLIYQIWLAETDLVVWIPVCQWNKTEAEGIQSFPLLPNEANLSQVLSKFPLASDPVTSMLTELRPTHCFICNFEKKRLQKMSLKIINTVKHWQTFAIWADF